MNDRRGMGNKRVEGCPPKRRPSAVTSISGLKRCGKSCRLRWMNYLSPNVKRDGFTQEEEDLIVRLHNLLGNRWSLIAKRVPGRTDNQVKNYWNIHLSKKLGVRKIKSTPSNDKSSSSPTEPSLVSTNPSLCSPGDIIPADGEPKARDGKDSGESTSAVVYGSTVDNPYYRPNFWDFEDDLSDFNVMELLGEDSHDLSWLYS